MVSLRSIRGLLKDLRSGLHGARKEVGSLKDRLREDDRKPRKEWYQADPSTPAALLEFHAAEAMRRAYACYDLAFKALDPDMRRHYETAAKRFEDSAECWLARNEAFARLWANQGYSSMGLAELVALRRGVTARPSSKASAGSLDDGLAYTTA